MLALYRAGRQADALEAYRRARTVLVEELGLEPSRELQQLEAAILAQDPALDSTATPPPRPRRAAPPLPEPPDTAARPRRGPRDRDGAAETTARLLTLTGPGGIGKTRFALELAHRLGGAFPDGAHFLALGAVDDPARVAAELEPRRRPEDAGSSSTTSSRCSTPRPSSAGVLAASPGRSSSSRAARRCGSPPSTSSRSARSRRAGRRAVPSAAPALSTRGSS